MNIPKLIALIEKLPDADKTTLYEAISPMIQKSTDDVGNYMQEIREKRFASKPHCPFCRSSHIVGYGKYRGRQRYMCRDCRKTFNDLSASPLAGTHYPDKWAQHIVLLLQGAVLKDVASKLDIHISTAFYWRHKVLAALCAIAPGGLHGIIESDEKFFLTSNKGKNQVKRYSLRNPRKRGGVASKRGISDEQVCVLVAMDRAGDIISKVAGRGRISAKVMANTIGSYIPDDATLCSDTATNYMTFARERGIKHIPVNVSKKQYVKDKVYHIQHVNSYHSRMEDWINHHFRGVATKHLGKYLEWQRFLELNRNADKLMLKNEMLTTVFKPDCICTIGNIRPA